MMKLNIMRIFTCNNKVYDDIASLLILPLIFSVSDFYTSVWSLIVIITVLTLNLGLSLILSKFKLSYSIPISLMLSGAIFVIYSKGYYYLLNENEMVTLSSILFAQFVSSKYSREESSIIKEMKYYFISLLKYFSPIIILSLIREILSTGRILNGFINNGLLLFGHKFGAFINSFSGVFLIITVITLLLSLILSKREVSIAKPQIDHYVLLSISWLLSGLLMCLTLVLNKISFIKGIIPVIPFLMAAIIGILLIAYQKSYKAPIITVLSLMITYASLSRSNSVLNAWILWGIIGLISCVICLYIHLFNDDKRLSLLQLSRILLLSSVVLYISEKLI